MTTVNLTDDTFEQAVIESELLLVDFWASWCGPCRSFAPIYEAASALHPEIVFGKIDTEAEVKIAAAAQITSIPTLMMFREGVLVFSQPGALPAAALEEVIDSVKALEMGDVHRRIDRQRELHDKPREVSVTELVGPWRNGAKLVDVREPGEYATAHVPGVELIPLAQLTDRIDQLPSEEPIYVICASGNRSLRAVDLLRSHGLEAYSVAGGTSGWASAGNPIEAGAPTVS